MAIFNSFLYVYQRVFGKNIGIRLKEDTELASELHMSHLFLNFV